MRPAAALGLLPAALWSVASVRAQEPPTFGTGIETIRVDVLVTEAGRPLQGLGPEDFEVRDDGVPQEVAFVSSEELPLNLILALDASASVAGEPLDQLRRAGRALLDRLEAPDRAALVTFSHQATVREPLTDDVSRVERALARVEPLGQTAAVDGCYAAVLLAEAEVGRDLVIVFSDGVDTSSWLTREQVVEAGRYADVVVYGVTLRGADRPELLRELSELSGGALLEVDSTRDLSGAFLRILEEFRHRYLLHYTPRGVSREGWHRLQVTVKDRRATVRARAGYVADR